MLGRIRLFCICDSQDNSLRQTLEAHLTSLADEGLIEFRHMGLLLAGTHVSHQLAAEVTQAGVVLLLLSADFVASALCRSLLALVQEQVAARRLLVVPVLARPVDWRGAGLGDRPPLPRNGQPVALWQNQDAAWVDVAEGLRALLTGAPISHSSKEIVNFAGERIPLVVSINQQGGQTAGIINNFERPSRRLVGRTVTAEILKQLRQRPQVVAIEAYNPDGETNQFAQDFFDCIGQIGWSAPSRPSQTICPDPFFGIRIESVAPFEAPSDSMRIFADWLNSIGFAAEFRPGARENCIRVGQRPPA